MDLDENMRGLLGKIGLVGLRSGLAREAMDIFGGLRALCPDRPGPVIGLAMAYLADDRFTEAEALLEKLPDDPDAGLYLGMARRLQGREAEAVEIWTLLAASPDGRIAASAAAFLEIAQASKRSVLADYFRKGQYGS